MKNSDLHVLVIGAGSIGTRHLRLIHEMGHPVAACDVDDNAFNEARKHIADLETYTDLSEALAVRPDIVVVATAHHLHKDHTIAALEAGAHVLCEKPMADSVEAATDMIAAAERAGRVLHIGFMNRYHPCIEHAREWVASGKLGLPLFASADLGSYLTLMCSRSRHQENVFAALLLDYTHQLDFVPFILGKPVCKVYAASRNRGSFALKSNPNCITMILEHGDGPISEIHLDYCRHPQVATFSVTGDKASVQCDLMTYTSWVSDLEKGEKVEKRFDFERDDLYRISFRNLLKAINEESNAIISGHEGRRSLEVAAAVLESLKTGQPVAVNRK